jgi:hypothetical protein
MVWVSEYYSTEARWISVFDGRYALVESHNSSKSNVLLIGVRSVVPSHGHLAILAMQIPELDTVKRIVEKYS